MVVKDKRICSKNSSAMKEIKKFEQCGKDISSLGKQINQFRKSLTSKKKKLLSQTGSYLTESIVLKVRHLTYLASNHQNGISECLLFQLQISTTTTKTGCTLG